MNLNPKSARCMYCDCPISLSAYGDWEHSITRNARCELYAFPPLTSAIGGAV